MSRFFVWNDDNGNASAAPYVFSSDGALRDRWPTNLGTVPSGEYPEGAESPHLCPEILRIRTAVGFPGGRPFARLPLDCRRRETDPSCLRGRCDGLIESQPLRVRHRVECLRAEASSARRDPSMTTTPLIATSRWPPKLRPAEHSHRADRSGWRSPSDSRVSSDGSHILMAAGATGPCGTRLPVAAMRPISRSRPLPDAAQPPLHAGRWCGHLRRVRGSRRRLCRSAPDGTKVYFTTRQQLTPKIPITAGPLHVEEETEPDQADLDRRPRNGKQRLRLPTSRRSAWSTCSNQGYCQLPSGHGGNCLSDTAIAADTGDIFFFSPERLDGSRGVPNQENLYDYRNDGQICRHVYTGRLLHSDLLFTHGAPLCRSPGCRSLLTAGTWRSSLLAR